MSITKKIRFEVFKRDGFQCLYCGATPPEARLEADHINPTSKGGLDVITNLITSCFSCNRGKAANKIKTLPQTVLDHLAQHKEENNHGYIFLNKDIVSEVIMLKERYCLSVYIYLLLKANYYKRNKGLVRISLSEMSSTLGLSYRFTEEALDQLKNRFVFFDSNENRLRKMDIIVIGYKDKV